MKFPAGLPHFWTLLHCLRTFCTKITAFGIFTEWNEQMKRTVRITDHSWCCSWSEMGPTTVGSAFGPLTGGLSCGLLWPGGWRTLHLGVGPLICPGRDCLCGGAPSVWSASKGGFSLALGPGARPCLCLIGAVGLCLCVCMCVHVCVCLSPCLSGYLWGWEGWYILSLLFLASV